MENNKYHDAFLAARGGRYVRIIRGTLGSFAACYGGYQGDWGSLDRALDAQSDMVAALRGCGRHVVAARAPRI